MPGPADDPTADGYLLLSEEFLADLAQDAVDYARSLGASEAMAIASDSGGMTMRISNGRIETARRDGTQSLGITVYDAQRTGRASTQALDRAAVHRAVDQAVAIARQVQPDDLAGLADPAWIARDLEKVPLFAPSGLSGDQLADAALQIERGALDAAGSDRVRVVDAAASSHDSRWARAISHGFCEAASSSINHRWCVAIGERDEAMVRDYWSSSDRRADFLEDPAAVGREAAERALAKLGGAGLGTQRAPVLLDARMAASLVGDFTGTLNGMAQYQGQTYFPDPVGKDLLAAHLSLTEDPFEPYGLASAAHDSDGIAGSRRAIVDRGVVEGLFVSALAARKLKTAPTGNADGPGNLTLTSSLTEPGDDLAAMFRRMGRGVWITEFLGGGVNPVNGAYSKAASGFWIEGGEISHPVHDFTVAGDLPTMLRGIVGVGANVHREGGIRTGAILIDEMQIAGR
jgi:PmbA protein